VGALQVVLGLVEAAEVEECGAEVVVEGDAVGVVSGRLRVKISSARSRSRRPSTAWPASVWRVPRLV
jgi:hypothetical protein